MNVFENIAYGLRVRKVPKEEIQNQVFAIAKKIDLSEDQLYKKVSELSGGQQQRVAIARAMVIKPKILCLDEPLSNLDAKLRHKLRKELKSLQKDFGITTIYVTHDQEEALTLSDRIAVFDNGNLQQVGTPDEIYNTPKTEFVANFIGEVNKINPNKFIEVIDKPVKINSNQDVYILVNDITMDRNPDFLEINVKVIDYEFFGFYVKYTLETQNNILMKFIVFRTNNDEEIIEVNKKINVYVNPNSIKQFNN
jgi:iron(III) transport system ATP-binding protein